MPDFFCLACKGSIYSCISTTTILESDRKLKLFTSIFFPRYYRCSTMQVLEYHCRMFGSSLFDFLKDCKMYMFYWEMSHISKGECQKWEIKYKKGLYPSNHYV